MRLNRFYLENFSKSKTLELKDNLIIHQIKNVLRLKIGEQISLFCNFSEAIYEIKKIDKASIYLNLIKDVVIKKNDLEIILFPALIKKDKLEWVVQKAVELGVTKIIPVISARSEKKDINLNRLNKISIEASEQCGRSDLVEIFQPIKFKDVLKDIKGQSFLANANGDNFVDCLKLIDKNKLELLNIFIGPEGGFEEVEIELAKKNNIKIVSFGDNILRSETAALVGLTLITNF